ncbi:MAG TPA: preprotein translocase subunit SecE [Spirochaetota bacterium]|nr:preprotein translocase subunit SecE [Spirochaetota bacterium]HPP03295.1 preprotein translocase subunit SecE [Spirochaetota bacterium]
MKKPFNFKIFNFIKESYAELKKVNWPTREDVVSQTIVVVVSLVIVSVLLTIIDFVSLEFISKIITLGM